VACALVVPPQAQTEIPRVARDDNWFGVTAVRDDNWFGGQLVRRTTASSRATASAGQLNPQDNCIQQDNWVGITTGVFEWQTWALGAGEFAAGLPTHGSEARGDEHPCSRLGDGRAATTAAAATDPSLFLLP
jgi:hypothetical protein